MKSIQMQGIVGLIMVACNFLPLSIQATPITGDTVTGDFTATGNADIEGTNLTLGTNSAWQWGWAGIYSDGTNSTVDFEASRAVNAWRWSQNASSTAKLQMTLNSLGNNELSLYNSSGTAVITLNPSGSSTIGGTDNEMPSQTYMNSNSVLTAGLGDARYLHPNGSGYVGIGTSSPSYGLDVSNTVSGGFNAYGMRNLSSGSTAYSIFQVYNDTANTAGFFMNSSARTADGGTSGFSMFNDGGPIRLRSTGNMSFATGAGTGTDRLTLLSSGNAVFSNGNVGVGTSSPLALLSVGSGSLTDSNLPIQIGTGGTGTESNFGINKNGSYGLLLGYKNDAGSFNGYTHYIGSYVRMVNTDPFAISVNNMNISGLWNSGGDVGLGGTITSSAMAGSVMTVKASGNVGIGTASPAAKLEVNGTAQVDGAVTASGTVTAPTFVTTSSGGDIPMFSGY